MANGPYYGVVARFTSGEPFEELLEQTKKVFKSAVQNLPGLRSASYFHIQETNEYCAAYAFATEADADQALDMIRSVNANTHMEIVKADVANGMQFL